MKKHVVSLLLLWSVVFGVWAEKGFVIQGSVDGITPQSMISLYRVDNGKRSRLDKAYVTRGRFKLTGKTAGSTAEEVYIMLSDKKSPSRTLALWVLPGAKIKVFGDNRIAALWTVESDVAEQKESNLYAAAVRPFLAEYWNYYPEKAKLEALYRDKNTPREKRSAVRKQINAITAKQDSIQSLMYKAEIDIMQTAPVGDIWLMHLAQLAMVSRTQKNFPYKAELVNLYENRMTDVLKAKEYGVVARANLFQRTVDVGDALVDADLYDLAGGVHHLSDYRGKYVLLDFWARSCAPCLAAMPELAQLFANNSDSLVVVGLSLDDEDTWLQTSREKKISWVNLNEKKGAAGLNVAYNVSSIPHYVLISPEGKVLSIFKGYKKNRIYNELKKYIAVK